MKRALVVFGDQTADEIISAAHEACANKFDTIRKFLYTDQIDKDPDFRDFIASSSEINYILGMIDVRLKPKVKEFAQSKNLIACSIIHPTAYVAPTVTIGEGTFVAPQAVISVNAKIGAHSVIHIHSSVGHDCQIGEYCAVLPGARISGNVTLEECVMIGSGAFVFQGVRVGSRSQIDALTYVRNDVPAKHTVSCRSK
jgi:sugar O-acyltransferase (sialic acid O-acetyltransferase NeuD family)